MKRISSRPPWFSGGLAITEAEFYDAVRQRDADAAARLPAFFAGCADSGLTVVPADSAMTLYWLDERFGKVKFATLFKDGTLGTNHICAMARDAGDRAIGERYLQGVAALIDGAAVDCTGSDMTRCVRRDGALPPIGPVLARAEAWLGLVRDAIAAFRALAASTDGGRGGGHGVPPGVSP
jgi:hypothetical protein